MKIKVTNPELYTEAEIRVETVLYDSRNNPNGFRGDVSIDTPLGWKTWSGEHGLREYEQEFGFILLDE